MLISETGSKLKLSLQTLAVSHKIVILDETLHPSVLSVRFKIKGKNETLRGSGADYHGQHVVLIVYTQDLELFF